MNLSCDPPNLPINKQSSAIDTQLRKQTREGYQSLQDLGEMGL